MAQKRKKTGRFLNVDLDVHSRTNLAALVTALEPRAFVLYAGREGTGYGAHFELATLPKNADASIRGLAGLIRALPRTARRLWDRATIREFNIGMQGASIGTPVEIQVSSKTVRDVALLKGRIAITVYPSALRLLKSR